MITTPKDARKIIKQFYGQDFKFRIAWNKVNVGVRPIFDPRPTLVYVKVSQGLDSAVRIGQLMPGGKIDWNWSDFI